jgi:hypothetical protein
VNSSTSSSNAHSRYVQGLLALVLAPWFGILAYGMYLQPFYGDLTRIGPHAEKDFGWNKPQLEFQRSLSSVGKYDRYFDVVVLGDSFSLGRPLPSWQNFVVAATGWSVIALNASDITPDQILANRIFRDSPPRIFIFESVERQIPHRVTRKMPCKEIALPADTHSTPVSSGVPPPVQFSEFKGLTRHIGRNTSWDEIKSEYVLHYLRIGLLRTFGEGVSTDAPLLELSRQAPFSSVNRNAILVYKDDIQKIAWWRAMPIPAMVCRIEAMRERFEANGQTRFVLMVAPDKLTAYADFIRDSSLRDSSILSRFAEHFPQIMPRLDLSLISAINRGVQDVYLPDDTHWGSAGHQIAAETLLGFLRR